MVTWKKCGLTLSCQVWTGLCSVIHHFLNPNICKNFLCFLVTHNCVYVWWKGQNTKNRWHFEKCLYGYKNVSPLLNDYLTWSPVCPAASPQSLAQTLHTGNSSLLLLFRLSAPPLYFTLSNRLSVLLCFCFLPEHSVCLLCPQFASESKACVAQFAVRNLPNSKSL